MPRYLKMTTDNQNEPEKRADEPEKGLTETFHMLIAHSQADIPG
jgi:hypothetical protein